MTNLEKILERIEEKEHLDTGMIDLGTARLFITSELTSAFKELVEKMEGGKKQEGNMVKTEWGFTATSGDVVEFNEGISKAITIVKTWMKS